MAVRRAVWRRSVLDRQIHSGQRAVAAGVGQEGAFYGDVIRPDGKYLAVGEPPYTSQDVPDVGGSLR
ncbi:hypothetical protein ACWDE0_30545 [Streptomyces sp. 900105755]